MDGYRLLGRSGLRVSPLALGTMTFGESWGADAEESGRIFDAYVGAGGNFIDTADVYADHRSEELIGGFLGDRRQRLVVASKYSLATRPGDPNSGGNHRKCMMQALEDSLRRLGTDYIDLYYLHRWDGRTPVDEVMRAVDDAMRQGKILYAGISNTPAWQVARMQTIADLRGWTPLVAMQIQYSLVQRDADRELIPAARELGLGVLPWSPLAGGILSGKYGDASGTPDTARQAFLAANGTLTPRALGIADKLRAVADAAGTTPARAAIAWLLATPGVTAPVLGVRTLAQLEDNLAAASVTLDVEQLAALDDASRGVLGYPHETPAFVADWLAAGTRIAPRS